MMLPLRRQYGAALLAMLLILALGASYFMVSRLDAMSVDAKAAVGGYNALVLNRAKQALIGYVAAQAVKAGENNPGALPCPEAAAYFDDPSNEGKVASSCSLPKVGRLPWRTLGLDKLTDASGEPLWYVVSPGWGYNGTNTSINSDSKGQLTLDGAAGTDSDTIVALIIAPGPAISVAAAAGCTAWAQTRPTIGTPDWRNYLECENATSPPDAAFASKGPSASFNDQVLALTKGDIMPAIEAAIANRIEREIVPVLKTVYTAATWGFSGSNPVLPFAAPFASPGPGAGTSNYQGATSTYAAGMYRGLLPFNQTQGCSPASDPRCTNTLMAWSSATGAVKSGGSGSIRYNDPCAWESADVFSCSGAYNAPTISLTLTATVTNVGMGLRAQDLSKVTCTAVDDVGNGWPTQNVACSVTGVVLQANGSAIITVVTSALPDIATAGWGSWALFKISFNRALIGDHALLSSTDGTTGWFVRNEWFRQMYYATVSGYTAATLPATPACTTGTSCLSIANVGPAGAQRAILILAGRSINGTARPSATLADYLEFGNATAAFERQTVSRAGPAALKRPFNDRIVVIDSN